MNSANTVQIDIGSPNYWLVDSSSRAKSPEDPNSTNSSNRRSKGNSVRKDWDWRLRFLKNKNKIYQINLSRVWVRVFMNKSRDGEYSNYYDWGFVNERTETIVVSVAYIGRRTCANVWAGCVHAHRRVSQARAFPIVCGALIDICNLQTFDNF